MQNLIQWKGCWVTHPVTCKAIDEWGSGKSGLVDNEKRENQQRL